MKNETLIISNSKNQTKNSEIPNHYSLHCPNSKNAKAKIQSTSSQKGIYRERHPWIERTNQAEIRRGKRHNQSPYFLMERDERPPHRRAWEKSSWEVWKRENQGSCSSKEQILSDEKGADRGNDASNHNRDEEDQNLRMKCDCSQGVTENGKSWTAWAL